VGDKIVTGDPMMMMKPTDAICTQPLSTLLHCIIVMEQEAAAVEFGLSQREAHEYAYAQCVDTGEPYTSRGEVHFRCRRIRNGNPK
jgi:hypothetical protein